MKNKASWLLAFAPVDAPEALCGRVLEAVAFARRRAARLRLAALSLVVLASGIALVPVLQYAAEEFYDSGFYDYLSLLFSDHAFVVSSWGEFFYSLAESLPSLALLLLAGCASILCWSAWRALSNAKIAFRRVGIASA